MLSPIKFYSDREDLCSISSQDLWRNLPLRRESGGGSGVGGFPLNWPPNCPFLREPVPPPPPFNKIGYFFRAERESTTKDSTYQQWKLPIPRFHPIVPENDKWGTVNLFKYNPQNFNMTLNLFVGVGGMPPDPITIASHLRLWLCSQNRFSLGW